MKKEAESPPLFCCKRTLQRLIYLEALDGNSQGRSIVQVSGQPPHCLGSQGVVVFRRYLGTVRIGG
jgi:hypothetical protein